MRDYEYFVLVGYLAPIEGMVMSSRYVEEDFDTLEEAKRYIKSHKFRFFVIKKIKVTHEIVEENEE